MNGTGITPEKAGGQLVVGWRPERIAPPGIGHGGGWRTWPRGCRPARRARLRNLHRRHQRGRDRRDCRFGRQAWRRDRRGRRRPDAGRRAGGGGAEGRRSLGRHRHTGQQCRLRRHRTVPRLDVQGVDADAGAQRHGARHGLQGSGQGDARPALRPHRQHNLARLAHGAARLHRLHRQQGRRRFDHPRRRGRAGALWGAGQQPGARHDGHRDAALDRGRPRPRQRPQRPAGISRRAHRAASRSAGAPRFRRSPRRWSGWRWTPRPT